MTVALSQSPTYQLPGGKFNITASATVGNFVRVAVTSAPEGSAYDNQIVEANTTELVIGEIPVDIVWSGFEPDIAGAYTLKLYELQVGATDYGGYYQGDPDEWPSETIVGTSTATIYAGQRLELSVGAGSDTATLALHVWDTTVRETTVAEQGVATPALLDPKTSKAVTFTEDATVVSALSDMIDVAASSVAIDPTTQLDSIITEFEDHLVEAGVHAANDTDNTPATSSLIGATSQAQILNSAGTILQLMRQHFDNDSGAGQGAGSASYHSVADRANAPVVSPPSDYAQSTFSIADMRRAYEAHRVNTTYHASADTTNTVAAPATGTLLALYEAIAVVLAAPSPTPPSTDNPGTTVMVHRGGLGKA
jgi:hypothetical protein